MNKSRVIYILCRIANCWATTKSSKECIELRERGLISWSEEKLEHDLTDEGRKMLDSLETVYIYK